jgi:hypothetical protein
MVLPLPSGSTKASPTPRVTTTPSRNTPAPTQTQPQQVPRLNGEGSVSSCDGSGADWVVTLSVTATLTGASSGNNPQGLGGRTGQLRNLEFNGDGGTEFSASTQITIGPSSEAATGDLQWNVTVTVPGHPAVEDSGTVQYNCSL